MRSFKSIAVLVGLALAGVLGCAGLKPIPSGQFVGNCATSSAFEEDTCDDAWSICQGFDEVREQTYASAADCRQGCIRFYQEVNGRYAGGGCTLIIRSGSALCEQQCLRQYPAP